MSPLSWMFVYTAISFYCLAGSLLEHFGLFAGWPYVPESDFRKVRTVQGMGSLFIYVVPKLLLTVLVLVLLVLGLTGVNRTLLWVSLIMLTISWVSSAFIQIPLQLRLQRAKDPVLMARLIRTNWIRNVAMIVHCVAVCLTVSGLLRTGVPEAVVSSFFG